MQSSWAAEEKNAWDQATGNGHNWTAWDDQPLAVPNLSNRVTKFLGGYRGPIEDWSSGKPEGILDRLQKNKDYTQLRRSFEFDKGISVVTVCTDMSCMGLFGIALDLDDNVIGVASEPNMFNLKLCWTGDATDREDSYYHLFLKRALPTNDADEEALLKWIDTIEVECPASGENYVVEIYFGKKPHRLRSRLK